ncbi:hypothetical protein K435DRAFT_804576 [Dendrothele bispora CBS 962.96]|uniref:Secreted protein n=1 Tax=Dendrothele bispora (strain CBS 962.96) TaxID=1314807 RepID=A0A4S8LDX4_DENBC|nr:hypothetical protein K435DRAFT_804576 [Dendrothele bispora CBS 962.96]
MFRSTTFKFLQLLFLVSVCRMYTAPTTGTQGGSLSSDQSESQEKPPAGTSPKVVSSSSCTLFFGRHRGTKDVWKMLLSNDKMHQELLHHKSHVDSNENNTRKAINSTRAMALPERVHTKPSVNEGDS